MVLIGAAVFTDLSFHRGGDRRPHPLSRGVRPMSQPDA
jgi:hypothetical protein